MPTITKNLVSVGQIVDQAMQVRFTHHDCFVVDEDRIIVRWRREGRMFVLDTNNIYVTMFAKG